jgi:hypothetical protein
MVRGPAISAYQMYGPAQQGSAEFYRQFSSDMNDLLQAFARNRMHFYGIRTDSTFELIPSVHWEPGSGETVTGYVLKGDFQFDVVKGDHIYSYRAIVEPVEIDGPQQTGCDVQPSTKLFLTGKENLVTHKTDKLLSYEVSNTSRGVPVTDAKSGIHAKTLRGLCDLMDRISDLCLDLQGTLEDYYGDTMVTWSAEKRGF